MKRVWLLSVLLVGWSTIAASAQTAVPTSKLAWNQQGPDLATVQAYTYKYYADGATTGIALAAGSVTCTAFVAPDTSGFSCSVAFPAFAPGTHTLTMTASNVAGESAQAAPLSFKMVVIPSVPGNVRIQ